MVEGPSGILSVFPPNECPEYEPSKSRITFHTGAVASTFTSEKPDKLRGPQGDTDWFDELCAFIHENETWDMAKLGRRIRRMPGRLPPQAFVSTTPRPTSLIKTLVKHPRNVITAGSTYDNQDNLDPDFLEDIRETWEGTARGRQELYGELLDEMPGALWTRAQIDANRIKVADAPEHYTKVVVGVDPAISSGGTTGIVVVGADNRGHGYVLADCSVRGLPGVWAKRVVNTYKEWKADVVVCEINQGGDMCVANIATVDPHVPVKVTHASRGKRLRAEPIAAKSEQGKFHHVGSFAQLEDQMCCWTPEDKESPDRLDACVHAANSAVLGGQVHGIRFGDVGKRISPNRI
jgi:phage terminase large subunit-like protein